MAIILVQLAVMSLLAKLSTVEGLKSINADLLTSTSSAKPWIVGCITYADMEAIKAHVAEIISKTLGVPYATGAAWPSIVVEQRVASWLHWATFGLYRDHCHYVPGEFCYDFPDGAPCACEILRNNLFGRIVFEAKSMLSA